MGFLTDNAAKSYKKVSSRSHVPDWWPVAVVIIAVICGISFLVNMIFNGRPADEVAEPGGATVEQPADPTGDAPVEPMPVDPTTDPASPTTTPAPETSAPAETTPPASTEVVEMLTVTGEQTTVPAGANETASKVAVALFTGDFSGVPLGEGVEIPAFDGNPAAILFDIKVGNITNSVGDFTAQVDANGANDIRTVTVTVVLENGTWNYYPPNIG